MAEIDEIHLLVGRMALMVYRLESPRSTKLERSDAMSELTRLASRLNDALNPPPPRSRRKRTKPPERQSWFMPTLAKDWVVVGGWRRELIRKHRRDQLGRVGKVAVVAAGAGLVALVANCKEVAQ